MQRMLPNVYQELFDGLRLVVKNTFVDMDESASIAPVPKSRSLPKLPSIQRLLEEDEGNEHLFTGTPLNEVRTRVFSGVCRSDTLRSDASTCASPASCASDERMPSLPEHLHDRPSRLDLSLGSDPCSSDSVCDSSSRSSQEEGSSDEAGTTTFMIRSLPRHMTRTTLEQLLDSAGFSTQYDFIYLPANLKKKENYGYGFVNLVSPGAATRFVKYFSGYSWPDPRQEPMGVHESEALQGLDSLIERYRNSPLMHSSVSEDVRPAIYEKGVKVPFPSPTVDLRAPRVRG